MTIIEKFAIGEALRTQGTISPQWLMFRLKCTKEHAEKIIKEHFLEMQCNELKELIKENAPKKCCVEPQKIA